MTIDFGAVAAVLIAVWLGALYMTGRGPFRPEPEVVEVCCCADWDDFELWADELDPDFDEPAVVTSVPCSDEELLDLAYGLPLTVVVAS